MDASRVVCALLIGIVTWANLCLADHEYMVRSSESIKISLDFETKLMCEMNIEPDKFQWKFYPLPRQEASNPKAAISLSKSDFVLIPAQNYSSNKKRSDLTIVATSEDVAGDYQCLAYYGASVVASVPWRITIANLRPFPKQKDVDAVITAGNTVNWRCEPPESNPEASIDYFHNDKYIRPSGPLTQSLIIPNVRSTHTGRYRCRAINMLKDKLESSTVFNLRVVNSGPSRGPYFIVPPKKVYTVNKDESVFLECSAVGHPIPQVVWTKNVGEIPNHRAELVPGGLIIKNVSSVDDGTYVCTHKNSVGTVSHQITLIYNEPPSVECMFNSTDVKQGEDLDLECAVRGTPDPEISWFLNGFSVLNDSAIEAVGNTIYFRPVEKRHAGNLQIFARNVVKTVYSSISIKVIPLSTSVDVALPPSRPRHRGGGSRKSSPKHTKMVPPTKPSVTRLNDYSVIVRWSVPSNKGLPIQFFKVQYRELGSMIQHEHHKKSSKWQTTNADIPPHIGTYEVNGLKPDHVYRFRIAAVYSNNDNKNSPNSDKFYLRRMDFDIRNTLPIPLITHTESVNSTAIKIYWKYNPVPNITLDGFHINYLSASSAADYMKATVDGEHTNSYVLCHLQPDTVYDIKLQSFNSKSASEFSSIMKARTEAIAIISTTPEIPVSTSGAAESAKLSKLYVLIAVGVVLGCGTIFSITALLLFCRKWKQKKNTTDRNDRDKPAVDDHHIQADASDYVVNTKNSSRNTNGCIGGGGPPNRITITANPLADADNKNQNMIEMSCLSSQNNNCAALAAAAAAAAAAAGNQSGGGAATQVAQTSTATSGEESHSNINKEHVLNRKKNREKRSIRNNKNNLDNANVSGENYV